MYCATILCSTPIFVEKKLTFKQILLLLSFTTGFLTNVQAQKVTFSGTIINQEDQEPILGANVIIKNTIFGTVSDLMVNLKLNYPQLNMK